MSIMAVPDLAKMSILAVPDLAKMSAGHLVAGVGAVACDGSYDFI